MAELKYDPKTGRLLFTEEMKKEYKILVPNMLPIHFELMVRCLRNEGYNIDLLKTTNSNIVDEGLKNVHNDTCYPALLVIGQFLDALKSGKYDPDKVALMITQTGGGCRASNYIHLLRKALKRAGYENVPVISLNLSGLEKNPGFKLNYKVLKRMVYALVYGDMLMLLSNQTRPYEANQGETDALVEKWHKELSQAFKKMENVKYKKVKANCRRMIREFAQIHTKHTEKLKVGVVGEIYIKYAALGNNNLEDFLRKEEAEVVIPGLIDFAIFKIDNRVEDFRIYGGNPMKYLLCKAGEDLLKKVQRELIGMIKEESDFRPMAKFDSTKGLVKPYLGYGVKMGEGWLLTGEMLELIHSGVDNIVCAQPFGCLPNHIVGKGMIRAIKDDYPMSNIVAIDYDPGATRINQENRIKLMMINGRMNMKNKKNADNASTVSTAAGTDDKAIASGTVSTADAGTGSAIAHVGAGAL